MDNRTTTDNMPDTADTATAEKEQSAATDLGKFKNVQALMDAYTALEAEFTRRSQRLKELENATRESAAPAEGNATPPQADSVHSGTAEGLPSAVSDEVKDAIIGEYLAGVLARRSVPFVTGGSVVAAGRRTPKNLQEAGMLARKFFDHKED